ncbi:MAG TPA: tyrosine-type recombinase/integrase [Candidatus Bathyarchaeia archaeon]|nr:tyrosine-type recombinase/integrase [Candidatus Bathyarchaeia archaeon]
MAQIVAIPILSESQLLEMFARDCRDRQLTDETIRRYNSSIKGFLHHLQNHNINPYQVEKSTLIEFIRERRTQNIEQNTLERDFAAINSLYEFLVFQDIIAKNPVPGVRKRYLRRYKNEKDVDAESPRKLISVEEMSLLINSVLDTRDKAILTLLAKTGVRRGELIAMDVSDINWTEQSIMLKKFKKRSGRTIFFDDETSRMLKRWINQRQIRNPTTPALFIGEQGERLKRNGVYSMTAKYAERIGLHNSTSPRPEDHFSPHCFRHWFTTHLRRAGMDREFIKALRGDRRREAIDIYDRIDREELRRAYLAFIPQLGL